MKKILALITMFICYVAFKFYESNDILPEYEVMIAFEEKFPEDYYLVFKPKEFNPNEPCPGANAGSELKIIADGKSIVTYDITSPYRDGAKAGLDPKACPERNIKFGYLTKEEVEQIKNSKNIEYLFSVYHHPLKISPKIKY